MAIQKKQNEALNNEVQQKESFFDKNKKVLLYALCAVILLIVGFILYNNFVSKPKQDKANTTLAKAQELFMNGEYDLALNGDKGGAFPGMIKIADEYGSTDAGNLATLYAGLCYAQLALRDSVEKTNKEKWTKAKDYLEKYDPASDMMVGPAAIASLGEAYAHLGDLEKAASLLKDAAAKADNMSLSATYLVQAGEILESLDKKDEALKCYQTVKDKYFNSMAAQSIDRYIERVKK